MTSNALDSGDAIAFSPADDQVYAILRRDIIRGMLKPGEVLRLRELAARFQVSTTPVREALDRLRGDGLCIQAPHRGARVAALSVRELEDIQTIRMALEGEAAAEAVTGMSEADVRAVRRQWEAAANVWTPTGTASIDDYLAAIHRMYDTCYAATRRPRLIALIRDHRSYAERYLRTALHEPESLRDDVKTQERFVLACERREADAARTTIRELLAWTIGNVREQLRRARDDDSATPASRLSDSTPQQ